MDEPIKEFQGDYRFLSNFWQVQINYLGYTYPSVENAYQAQKSHLPTWKVYCTSHGPGEVKRKSRTIDLDPGWDLKKLIVMRELLRIKFRNLVLREQLLGTKTCLLQEGNRWHDTFWGVDLTTGKGRNHLGEMLMEIRSELQ